MVVGTERHEARRIDRQLRGRRARQGFQALSRFFVSFEDDLTAIFCAADRMTKNYGNASGLKKARSLTPLAEQIR